MPVTSWTPRNVLRPITAGFRPAAIQTATLARGLAPKRTGRLARRTRVTFTAGGTGLGASLLSGTGMSAILHAPGAPYIYPVTKGSRAHAIEPRDRRALKIGDRFAARVSHPGHAPNPYLNRAAAAFPALYAAETRRRWPRR